jgi:uncharacterized protein (DUF305 family)
MDKKNSSLFAFVAVLVLGGIAGYLLADYYGSHARVSSENYQDGSLTHNMHRMSDGTLMHNDEMMAGHMNMVVTSERSFIEGMIPHHQEAVDTAREVLERGGTTAEMRALAENIIMAQETEIANMKLWYENWYGTPYQDTDAYVPMMRDLSQLSGALLDKAFLEDMIMHHMGAIMMARSVEPYLEHKEMIDLVQAVIETQSAEIQQMQKILREI